MRPSRSSITWEACVGLTWPERLAEGAAIGLPVFSRSRRAKGCAGTRSARLSSPARAKSQTLPCAANGTTSVSGAGPEGAGKLARRRVEASLLQGGVEIGKVSDQRVEGGPAFRRIKRRHGAGVRGVAPQPIDRLGRKGDETARAQGSGGLVDPGRAGGKSRVSRRRRPMRRIDGDCCIAQLSVHEKYRCLRFDRHRSSPSAPLACLVKEGASSSGRARYMTLTYRAPVAEMLFTLRHVAGLDRLIADGLAQGVEEDISPAILEEAAKFAAERLAPLNRIGDQRGTSFKDGVVTTAPGFREAYRDWAAAGWNGSRAPPNLVASTCRRSSRRLAGRCGTRPAWRSASARFSPSAPSRPSTRMARTRSRKSISQSSSRASGWAR